MGDDGITPEKYETMSIDRHLTPITFYGMDIEPGVFKSAPDDAGSIQFKYRVVSQSDGVSRVEIDVDGKIYNVEVPVKKSSKSTDMLDQNYLIGLVENLVNPC